MAELKFEVRRVLDRTVDEDMNTLRRNPRMQQHLAARMKYMSLVMSAQAFGYGAGAAAELALAQMSDADRAAMARDAEPVVYPLLSEGSR